MAEAGDGSGHTPLTPEWTPAPRASHNPWQGDRPAPSVPSIEIHMNSIANVTKIKTLHEINTCTHHDIFKNNRNISKIAHIHCSDV